VSPQKTVAVTRRPATVRPPHCSRYRNWFAITGEPSGVVGQRGTVCAPSGHRELDGTRLEAMPAPEVVHNPSDKIASVVIDVAAHVAHQVKVFVGMGDLPAGDVLVAQPRLADQVELREQGQRPVHRRQVDTRLAFGHTSGELLDSQMALRVVQRSPDRLPGPGDTVSPDPQPVTELVGALHAVQRKGSRHYGDEPD
jgi:hypothetical protein